jgi:hypothetical protein
MNTAASYIEDRRERCREEAHDRALPEAQELARDDVRDARLYGAAAESFFRERVEFYYTELCERIFEKLMEED